MTKKNNKKNIIIAKFLLCFFMIFLLSLIMHKYLPLNNSRLKADVTNTSENKIKVSVLGDSISTYIDYIPSSYSNFYPAYDVDNVNKTWWYGLISELNMELGFDSSWGRTKLACSSAVDVSCFSSDQRVNDLGSNGVPDVIIIFGGTNDMLEWKIGSFSNTSDVTTLIGGYYNLISKIKNKYPKTRILAILPPRMNNVSNEQWSGSDGFYNIFKQIFTNNKIDYVDLSQTVLQRNYGDNSSNSTTCQQYYGEDCIHPNKTGMNVIKNEVKNALKKNIYVRFHKNYGNDAVVFQQFSEGVENQHFGKDTSGNCIWECTGQFGGWDREGYKLIGWSTDKNATTNNWSVYSGVSNQWITEYSPVVDLYAVWKKEISIPVCANKTYTGNNQLLFSSHSSGGYTNSALSGKKVGYYNVELNLNSGYIWKDGTTSNKTVTCSIINQRDYLYKIVAIDYGNKNMGDMVLLESDGKYLLMDTSGPIDKSPGEFYYLSRDEQKEYYQPVLDYLKNNNINTFDLYISHYDQDHNYYIRQLLGDENYIDDYSNYNFTIKNVYLPKIDSIKNGCDYFETNNYKYINSDYDNYIGLLSNLCGTVYRGCKEGSDCSNVNMYGTKHEYLLDGNRTFGYFGNTAIGGYLHFTLPNKYNNTNFIYITKGDKIKIGKATLEVIWHSTEEEKTTMDYYKNIDSNNPYDFYQHAIRSDGKMENAYSSRFANNSSLVSMISAGNKKFLTAGDIQYEVEQELIRSGINLKADILKLNHHSIGTSNTPDFINKIKPTYAFYQLADESESTSAISQENINNYSDENNPNYQSYLWSRNLYNAQYKTNGIYGSRYNGDVTFTIYDDDIDVDVNRNYSVVKVNYYNKSTNELIKTKTIKMNKKSYSMINTTVPGLIYKSGLEDFSSRKKIENDAIYNAYYEPMKITIKYYKNDGTNSTASQNFEGGVENQHFGKDTSGNCIWECTGQFGGWKRTGYKLLGWSKNIDATSAYWDVYDSVSNNFIDSVYNNTSGVTPNQTINLYAVWKKIDEGPVIVDDVFLSVEINKTAGDLKQDLSNYSVTLYDKNGTVLNNNSILKTDYKAKINNNNYTIFIKGDFKADGKVNINDIQRLYDYLFDSSFNKNSVTDAQRKAGEMTNDTRLNINDVQALYDYFMMLSN